MNELVLLRKVEDAARRLREPVGYESGATSHDLDDALRALDDFRARPVEPKLSCVGHHDEFTYLPGVRSMTHHCHALGCKSPCPPRWLMCRACWSKVPSDLQAEVNRTVSMRGPRTDASWAPWWRAQARAIAHVAMLREPNEARRDAYLARELAFADTLEAR